MSHSIPELKPSVAAAIIVHNGRVLLVKRQVPEGNLSWQFPAGTVEKGESAGEAAVRETREETGLVVVETKILGKRTHPATDRDMVYVACEVLSGAATLAAPREIAAITWAEHHQLTHYVPHGFYSSVQAYLDQKLRPQK